MNTRQRQRIGDRALLLLLILSQSIHPSIESITNRTTPEYTIKQTHQPNKATSMKLSVITLGFLLVKPRSTIGKLRGPRPKIDATANDGKDRLSNGHDRLLSEISVFATYPPIVCPPE